MKSLESLINQNKTLRVIGFDDAPFEKTRGSDVNVSGIVCSNTRFEGMLWTSLPKDGLNATDVLINTLKNSKFYDQTHVVLTDGIAFGGFNLIDLPILSEQLNRPCIAVMRKQPDFTAIDKALKNFEDYEIRKEKIQRAGEVFTHQQFYFQVKGCQPEIAGLALERLTDQGHVPEALRLAHLIGSAIKTGQSSQRA